MTRVAVLGGGPAGGSAALALARGGVEVDLYLPARPGEKPCGGAVPEHVLPRVAGFDPSPLPAVVSPEAVLENARGHRLALDLDGIRIFRRRDFDRALVESALAAGAVPRRIKAERLERVERGVRVVAEGEARVYDWIVGADGARGLSRRALGLPPRGDSVGLGGSLSGLDWKRLVLAFPEMADAYLWISPGPAAPRSASPTPPAGSRTPAPAPRSMLSSTIICRKAGGTFRVRATAIRSLSSGPGPWRRCAGPCAGASFWPGTRRRWPIP
jgi:2-polyprenyl-6-methoxyphenol hydroxylase-like FAD-dependent oxidoreductase